MPKVRSPWPECYYEETDPLVRRELLTQAMAAGEGDLAENELRQKLWALRYGAPDKRGKRPPDGCIRFWVTATMCARDAGSRFGARAAAKELSRDLAALDLVEDGVLHRGVASCRRCHGRMSLRLPNACDSVPRST